MHFLRKGAVRSTVEFLFVDKPVSFILFHGHFCILNPDYHLENVGCKNDQHLIVTNSKWPVQYKPLPGTEKPIQTLITQYGYYYMYRTALESLSDLLR